MASRPQFVFCEATGFWAAAFRWQQRQIRWPIVETRDLAETKQRLIESPSSLAAIELTLENALELYEWLWEARESAPSSGIFLLLTPAIRDQVDPSVYLEFGRTILVDSPRRLDQLASWIDRHFAAARENVEATRSGFWDRLPWQTGH